MSNCWTERSTCPTELRSYIYVSRDYLSYGVWCLEGGFLIIFKYLFITHLSFFFRLKDHLVKENFLLGENVGPLQENN